MFGHDVPCTGRHSRRRLRVSDHLLACAAALFVSRCYARRADPCPWRRRVDHLASSRRRRATTTRTPRSGPTASTFPRRPWSTSAGVSRRLGGLSARRSAIRPRACSWRRLQALVHYWGTDYDWRKAEAKLNALPQFVTTIDGLDIQFIHVRSRHPNALPLIMTHGWPGSALELLKVIGPLTDPTAHGGRAEDAFDLVLPTYPGYGFSGKPQGTTWGPAQVARAWDTLMRRLGYSRYVSQGGDWGAIISQVMAVQAPPGLLGIHINMPGTVPTSVLRLVRNGDPVPAEFSKEEKAAYASLDHFYNKGFGYAAMMNTRPQTLGYALADSPVGHGRVLLRQVRRVDVHAAASPSARSRATKCSTTSRSTGSPTPARPRRAPTGMRRRAAEGRSTRSTSRPSPVAVTIFPGEIYRAPRTWADRRSASSSTGTKSTRAVTSPPGKSRRSSRPRSAPRSVLSGSASCERRPLCRPSPSSPLSIDKAEPK